MRLKIYLRSDLDKTTYELTKKDKIQTTIPTKKNKNQVSTIMRNFNTYPTIITVSTLAIPLNNVE